MLRICNVLLSIFSLLLPSTFAFSLERNNSTLGFSQNNESFLDSCHDNSLEQSKCVSKREVIEGLQDLSLGEIKLNPLDTYRILSQDLFFSASKKSSETNHQKLKELHAKYEISNIYKDAINHLLSSTIDHEDNLIQIEQKFIHPKKLILEKNIDSFSIKTTEGDVLYKFRGKIKDVKKIQNLIIFIDELGIQEENNVQFLYLIDLKEFSSAIGNAPLPVFQIPISLEDGVLSNIDILNNTVTLLNKNQVEFLSISPNDLHLLLTPQFITFNLTSSLLNPQTFEDTKVLIGDFSKHFLNLAKQKIALSLPQIKISSNTKKQILNFNSLQEKLLKKVKTNAKENFHFNFKDEIEKDAKSFAYDVVFEKHLPEDEISYELNKKSEEKMLELIHHLSDSDEINYGIQMTVKRQELNRTFMTRAKLFWGYLTLPNPQGGNFILDHLLSIMHVFSHKDQKLQERYHKENVPQKTEARFKHKGLTFILLSALGYGLFFPDALAEFLYSTLSIPEEISKTVLRFPQEKILNLTHHAKETFSQTVLGITNVPTAYFKDSEKIYKLAVGLTAITSFIGFCIGLPHIAVNTSLLIQDLSLVKYGEHPSAKFLVKAKSILSLEKFLENPIAQTKDILVSICQGFLGIFKITENVIVSKLIDDHEENAEKRSFFSKIQYLKKDFIQREIDSENRYRQLLIESQTPDIEEFKTIHFTQNEEEIIYKKLEEKIAQDKETLIGKTKHYLSSLLSFSQENKFLNQDQTKTKSFFWALQHFLFSFASFTLSGKTYATIAREAFFYASFLTRPRKILALFLYPELFSTLKETRLSPSKLNNAKLNRLDVIKLDFLKRSLTKDVLKKLETAEQIFLKNEILIQNSVSKESFKALASFISKEKDFKKVSHPGFNIQDEGDRNFLSLSFKARTFFSKYHSLLLSSSIQSYLKISFEDFPKREDFDIHSIKDVLKLKKFIVDNHNDPMIVLSQTQADQLVKDAIKDIFFTSAYKTTKHPIITRLKNFFSFSNSELLHFLSGKNNSTVSLYEQVKKAQENPLAMARATRYNVITNIIDKPMELLFIFLTYAGVQTTSNPEYDLMRPLQDTMFGPNSTFYLSNEVFGVFFCFSVFSGVLGGFWSKLLMDGMNENNFGKMIPKKFQNKSFLSYFWHQVKTPENSLWKNQLYQIKINLKSIRANLVGAFLIGLVFRGRFDLDQFFSTYFILFFTIIKGFEQKAEQTFELSTDYFKKDFNRKEILHPLVQKFLNTETAFKRFFYILGYRVIENMTLFYTEYFKSGANSIQGPRAFSRIFFSDFTLTEIAAQGLIDAHHSSVSNIPGAKTSIKYLLKLISKNCIEWKHVDPIEVLSITE